MPRQHKVGKRIIVMTAAGFLIAAALLLLLLLLDYTGSGDRQGDTGTGLQRTLPEREDAVQAHLFQILPELRLSDREGNQVNPLQKREGVTVLLFWASWCPSCRNELPRIDSLRAAAQESGAQFFLVDKLDGEKETKDQALALLHECGQTTETVFDEDCMLYEAVGLNAVPSLLVVDAGNRIISMTAGEVPSEEQLKDRIREAEEGKAASMAEAVCRTLLGPEGGMRTNYADAEGVTPSGGDVLSESQGILMEYAARAGNRELFDLVWGYTEDKLSEEGLMPWVIADGTDTGVNALVDDLRILGALELAQEKWGGYEEGCGRYRDAVYEWNTKQELPVDFYDAGTKEKAGRFTLCYGDLAVLSRLGEQDGRYRRLYDKTLPLILEGRISEKFPLYYSYYDYGAQNYGGGALNMAEALTTLLHLAEADELPPEALDWLEEELDRGCIYAAYDTQGSPAQDGYYESTAVYALLTMIALEEGREALAGKAVNRMEQFRIQDVNSECNRLFGNSDGTGIYSFDQGMALLAYVKYEEATE